MGREFTAVSAEAERRPETIAGNDEDTRLVAAARADPEAFVALYRRYVGPVHRYLLGQVGHRADAEDLTATVFVKALADLDRYGGSGPFAAWLFAIARHTLRDHLRRRRPTADLDAVALALPDGAPSPEEAALGRERASTLHRLLAALPPDQREALALRYFAGLPTATIAAIQGGSGGAIRMRLHRAVAALRARYDQEGLS
jgi:RNA polymerase sigma-70 factor (ECF subfamily)